MTSNSRYSKATWNRLYFRNRFKACPHYLCAFHGNFEILQLLIPQNRQSKEHIPDCDEYGYYQAKQCSSKYCWCVSTSSGEQIKNTLTSSSNKDKLCCSTEFPANCRVRAVGCNTCVLQGSFLAVVNYHLMIFKANILQCTERKGCANPSPPLCIEYTIVKPQFTSSITSRIRILNL